MATTSGIEIKEARQRLGWSQAQLAKKVNSHSHTISKIETGVIKFSRLMLPIREALGIVEKTPNGSDHAAAPHELLVQVKHAYLRCYYAIAHELEDTMVLRPEPTRTIPRPERLRNFEDAYSIMVAIAAMSPAYEVGDILYIDPYLPAEPGKDVLLRKSLNGSGAMVILARLIEVTRDGWLVRQHGNTRKKDFSVKKVDYPECHRIVGKINR